MKGMFPNDAKDSLILKEMKHHAKKTAEIIQSNDYIRFGEAIPKNWYLKNKLDTDINNQEIQQIIDKIDDYALGYMLPSAGGGGYLFILGKSIKATSKIRKILNITHKKPNARLVEIKLSEEGLKVTRS